MLGLYVMYSELIEQYVKTSIFKAFAFAPQHKLILLICTYVNCLFILKTFILYKKVQYITLLMSSS